MADPGKPVIVVADDDAGTRYVFAQTLRHEGFDVVEAGNGQEAIDAFTLVGADVILMDVEMPGTDGYQACETIRRSPGGTDVPIVMVTGHDHTESIDRAYQVGATDFIAKPINWSLIGHRLRYILRGAGNYRALGISEAENRALIAAIPDSIFIVDADAEIVSELSGQQSLIGYDGNEPASILTLFPADLRQTAANRITRALEAGQAGAIEYLLPVTGDVDRWFESRFIRHLDDKVLVLIRDITERKSAEEKIHRLAYFDALTGLPNRAMLSERLAGMLACARTTRDSLVSLNIDLNRFKRLNNSLGRSVGDAVLIETCARIRQVLEDLVHRDDTVQRELRTDLARIGGNEFAVLVCGPGDAIDAMAIAAELREVIARPLLLEGYEFVVTASIGVSLFPAHGNTVESLLKNAESARDAAKRTGRNNQKLYRDSMNSALAEGLNLENELRRALENDELEVYYQPKYRADTLEYRGAEALTRWFHPDRGEISPATFIPIAEESGLITDLGRWLAETVCEQIASWRYFGVDPGTVALNISGQEFGLGNPVETLATAISKAGIPARALEIEITETVLLSDIKSVMADLHQLREHGFALAVDDFGTGYSSLRYLQRFPVDLLKIDYSFVRDVESNSESRKICAAIIALARSLGLSVVGEGVESQWQLEFLKRESCDLVQGFLLSRPLSAGDLMTELRGAGDASIVKLPLPGRAHTDALPP